MIRKMIAIITLVFAFTQASRVFAEFCPADNLNWPTNCVPAYVGPSGALIPERCATFTPDVIGDLSSITIRDFDANGNVIYEAPVTVVEAVARQDGALQALSLGWPAHRYGTAPDGPRHAYDAARILDYQQLNDFVTAAIEGTRDTGPGTHVVFTAIKPTDTYKAVARLCTGATDYPRCQAAVTMIQNLEMISVNWGNKYGHSFSYEALSNMFAILVRSPVTPTTRCGE